MSLRRESDFDEVDEDDVDDEEVSEVVRFLGVNVEESILMAS